MELPSTRADLFVDLKVVKGSELGFVPKSAKTDRPICTEPLMNIYIQKGIGTYIRSRLRKNGCDLNNQNTNGTLARLGSIDGSLATVDLSSASDTISYMTVLELLPSDWFDLMDKARSRFYSYEGKTYSFEKFSSMGNGFTFELESLIFLALARATCSFLGLSGRNVSVYGDDIIVPVEAYTMLSQVLEFCGFTVNQMKSFHNGPFRESCGSDFFLGKDVRPVYLKKSLSNEVLMSLCNRIFRKSHLNDPKERLLYNIFKYQIPKEYHILKGPDGYGDGHFVTDWKPNRSPMLRRRGWEGAEFKTLASSPTAISSSFRAAYPTLLYELENRTESAFSHSEESGHTRNGKFLIQRRGKTRTVLRTVVYHSGRNENRNYLDRQGRSITLLEVIGASLLR
jgi:hypothetical protein